ncbi:WD40-repeat-containing domain protein [Pisolithus orientalis]|uniref:WD40-repeat-containing domain protein n=1 Tax=Pisolithus orientalis TaxID=936130 RepID=UPI002224BA20|nr:WD40-repeat-containing domain protein [Pisolithus orientalis]KAI6028537.1 WD40-repeat-containing domain protein [Pisolithus orientalis]
MPYKLSATLLSHTSDVRAVASPSDNLILSASRDSSAISWSRVSSSSFAPASILRAGSKFVNAVAYLPPTPRAPRGCMVVGGQDMVVNIFALDSSNKDDPEYTLVGHSDNVCTLNVGPEGTIISGSWDKTAKVWKNFTLQYDLRGHGQSVWSVLAISETEFLTASADKTIKFWDQHKAIRTYEGHRDAVRGLALVPDIGFASCSNDSEVRVWTMEGDTVYSLTGHTSFVYSLSVLPNGDLVSAGEDRSVRVWRDGECSQVLVHPAISVWTVSTMPNGDIVSGCSDGVIRVFSESEERWANSADLKAFEDQVSRQSLPSQQVGDVKKSNLPGHEALAVPGRKAGEVKMVRNGDVVEAHQWDSSSSSWQKIGEVVDAVGSSRKQLYNGKEYDYVFDVDIQEGAPPLKLPVNVSENPYLAAQRFLEQNDLSLSYLDQVVKFIEQNTAGIKLGDDSNYTDPYTGTTRYQPPVRSHADAASSPYMDPYTGANRYTASRASAPPESRTLKIIPYSKPLSFKQANIPAMQAKMYQFDEALRSEMSTETLAMHPEELKMIEEAFTYLVQASSQSSSPSTTLSWAHAETITQILDRWPMSQRFPVLDLCRLIMAYPLNAPATPGSREKLFDYLFKACDWTSVTLERKPMTKTQETSVLLLFRTIANSLLEETPLHNGQWVTQVFKALSQASQLLLTRTQKVALASILFNFSCIGLKGSVPADARALHLSLISQLLRSQNDDPEAAYRTCVALGNVLYATKSLKVPLDIQSSQLTDIKNALGAIKSAFPDQRIADVYMDIVALV